MRLSEVISALESGKVIKPGTRVLCAVSGGADSVALLKLLSEAAPKVGFEVIAAHVHHGIRAESDEELEFVSELCAGLGVPLCIKRANVPDIARSTGDGIENAARKIRYEFFYASAREHGCDSIALAHHMRDQAETVLMHALRGASISGLCGMRARSGMLVRPLLGVEPEELREYLAACGLDFREDKTNMDIHYTRNFVRHVILPECEKAYPGSRAGLCRLAESAALDDDFISEIAKKAIAECLFDYPGGEYIIADALRALHPAIRARVAAEAMRRISGDPEYAGIYRILAALDGENANLPGNVRVSRGASRIYLEKQARNLRDGSEAELRCMESANIKTPWGGLSLTITDAVSGKMSELGDGKYVQALDADKLSSAVIRLRRGGDRIFPLGAPGEKKLKDYYIDKKVDRQVRDYLPVVARGGQIIWALGVGVAQDCAVTPDTRRIVLMRWEGRKLWQ